MQSILGLFLVFLVFLILFSNIKGILFNCFHAYDLGIYQQGIFNIAAGESLNPYLTIRGVHTFNDHFMPVLFLAVPFVWAFNFHPTSMIVFEWFWFALLLFFLFKEFRKQTFSSSLILYSLGLVIFSKGILTGLEFPIHPGTWSIPIWLLLILKIRDNDEKGIILFSIILCLFRESYPFGILPLGLYYLVLKRLFFIGGMLTGFSLLYAFFVLVLRKSLLGHTADYGGKIVKGLLSNPIEYVWSAALKFEYIVALKIFLPFIVLFAILFYLEKKKNGKIAIDWRVPAIIPILPIYFLHFLTNQYHFHYGPAFVTPLLAIAIFSPSFRELFESKKVATFVFVIFIATASGRYTKFFNNLFLSKNNKCSFQDEYASDTQIIIQKMNDISLEKVILASGGLVQRVIRPRMKIYPPDTMVEVPPSVDILLLVRSGAGDTYPWNKEEVEEAIVKCSPFISKKIFESPYYFLAEGPFPRECFKVWKH